MFEERCLTCGNHLHDDGRAYCSDECQVLDTSSPCLSSASSAFSSPRIEYAVGGEVPPLIPSALGSALRGYRHRQSASSSSASSTSWSLDTDDEDQDDDDAFLASVSDADTADSASQLSSKSSSAQFELRPRPLSYARRPSGTNTRSTVPHLNKRGSSGSISGGPYSTDDCASFSDDCSEQLVPQSAPERDAEAFVFNEKDDTLTKSKRRNRASLPSYFSLLQIGSSPRSPSDGSKKGSPTVSTSSQTIARPSPPTPKLSLAGFTASLPPFTSRGRKLMSRGSHSSFSSSSRSQSNPEESGDVYTTTVDTTLQPRPRLDSRGTTSPLLEKVSHPGRGRAAIRRNSSPPAKLDGLSSEYSFGRRETTEERRGRARREELDGIGGPNNAPGFGHGRSGLLHREGRASSRFR